MKALCLAILLLPAGALAQEFDCRPPMAQVEINYCTGVEAAQVDRRLNRIWKRLKPQADAAGWGQRLLDEQRAWLRRRDRTCERERESVGMGSGAQMFFHLCITEMTRARNAELRALLN